MKVIIHSPDMKLSERTMELIEYKVLFSLSRFQSHFDSVDIYIKKLNHSRHRESKHCVINLNGMSKRSFVVTAKSSDLFGVIDKSLMRARSLLRRKLKPRRSLKQRLEGFGLEDSQYEAR